MVSTGALTQIAAKGPQNLHLDCRPEHSFFQGVYAKHTPFAIGTMEHSINNVNFGRTTTTKIERNGDCIYEIYVHVDLAPIVLGTPLTVPDPEDGAFYTNSVGYAMIEEATCMIGGHESDKRTGEFHEMWHNIATSNARMMTEMIGYSETVQGLINFARRTQYIYAPLQFWFNRHSNRALPLIALQYHEVTLKIKFRKLSELGIETGPFIGNTSLSDATIATEVGAPLPSLEDAVLLINYVFFDTAERRMFATSTHEYLFDQLQYVGDEAHGASNATQSFRLQFNHPTKALYWRCLRNTPGTDEDVIKEGTAFQGNDWFNFSGIPEEIETYPGSGVTQFYPTDPFLSAQIFVNGHTRTVDHDAAYYRYVTARERHTRIPTRYIYCYPFGLYPESQDPNGSINLSRIDAVVVRMKFPTGALAWNGAVMFYALSHNVAKLCSGMWGILYAN